MLAVTACSRSESASPHPQGRTEVVNGIHRFIPAAGFVPDERTAVAVGEAVLASIYGQKTIDGEKPLVAKLRDSVWTVTGTLPPSTLGGVAVVEVAKASGCILRVSHGL